ncbi:MAG TPA: 2-C-methyl-D-erythritol 4-phosphate cytidylyltransferase [Kineosporiaceae bacterium]
MLRLVQGIVPLVRDDPDAPEGCAGLRELGGAPLICRAVQFLARSGCISHVVVPVPSAVAGRVGEVLAACDGVEVSVLAVPGTDLGVAVLAALGDAMPGDGTVVLHDALHPLAPVALVPAVLDRLAAVGDGDVACCPEVAFVTKVTYHTQGGSPVAAGVVPVAPVTDTLKWIDDAGVVTGTADRDAYRLAGSPQAYRVAALRAALVGAGRAAARVAGPDDVPDVVRRAGGVLLTVPARAGSFRVTSADDVLLAEVMLGIAQTRRVDHGSR